MALNTPTLRTAALLLGLLFATAATHASAAGAAAPPIARLQAQASGGDAQAHLELARRYRSGDGVPMDRERALRHFEQAAARGSAQAAHELARHFHGLTGAQVDQARALGYLQQAADKGHSQAQTELAFVYFNGNEHVAKDLPLAFRWFGKAAASGSVTAECMLGDFYKHGWGGAPKDPARAVKWYQLTAVKDAACASKSQYELYASYESGQGVKKNLATATDWLVRSAEAGHPRAQRTLGHNHQRGYGVPADEGLARTWLLKSREGVSHHDDHEHNLPSFAGPEMTRRLGTAFR